MSESKVQKREIERERHLSPSFCGSKGKTLRDDEYGDPARRFATYPSEMNAPEWKPSEYRKCLAHERFMYAWCMRTIGHVEGRQARELARNCYPFETSTNECRGLVFHDEAWHWAMLKIMGEGYWRSRPDLANPSAEYREASAEFERGCRDR